jgi:hypothetical protein
VDESLERAQRVGIGHSRHDGVFLPAYGAEIVGVVAGDGRRVTDVVHQRDHQHPLGMVRQEGPLCGVARVEEQHLPLVAVGLVDVSTHRGDVAREPLEAPESAAGGLRRQKPPVHVVGADDGEHAFTVAQVGRGLEVAGRSAKEGGRQRQRE